MDPRSKIKRRLPVVLLTAALIGGLAQQNMQRGPVRSPHGSLNIACGNCHTSIGWKPLRAVPEFNHNRETKYPPKGMHTKALPLRKRERQSCQQFMLERYPERRRVHLVLGQLQLSRAHVLVRKELDFLETDDLGPHQHVAVRSRCRASDTLLLGNLEYPHLRVADGVGEVVHVHALHVGLALAKIKSLDVVLLTLMNVDRLGMDGCESGRKIHFTNHLRLSVFSACRINDDEIVGCYRTQADRVCRIAL